MSQANALRGEVALELGGRAWRLRPTFTRLVAAETEAGSLLGMVERAASGEPLLADVEALVWHCLDDEGNEGREALRAAIGREGLGPMLSSYRALLRAAMGGM